jgi:hypothetical protein
MSNKSRSIALIAASLAVLALSTTACGNLPISLAPATSTPVPSPTPASTALPAPQAATTPAAPQGKALQRANAAQVLQALLRGSGLTGGVVTSNDGSTLGLKLGKATQQLQVASNAIVVVPNKSNATVSDIRVGDRVVADRTDAATNAPAAFLLAIPAGYAVDNVMLGAVMPSKSGATSLRTPRGPRDVTTSASTMVVNVSGAQPMLASLSDLKPAMAVLVIGDGSRDAFNAQVIVIVDKDARNLLQKSRKNAPPPTPTRVP